MFKQQNDFDYLQYKQDHALHKKWSIPLRISSVNVAKSLTENFIFCAVHCFLAENTAAGIFSHLLWNHFL